MKIGIDARMLGPQCGGLGRYVEQLVLNLEKTDSVNQYVVFMREDNWHRFEPTNENFTKVLADVGWYSTREQYKMLPILYKAKVDLMHFPHWNIPWLYRRPFVVTIHDLIMYHFPRAKATLLPPFVYWLKDRLHRLLVKSVAIRAENIIVTSEFTREDIHQTLALPPEKMTVIYQAHFDHPPAYVGLDPLNQHKTKEVLKKMGIDRPYILYVGAAYPHKNLGGLLEAWKIFLQKHDDKYQLVLVGKRNYFYETVLTKIIEEKIPNIIFTDFVEDVDLVELYENSYLYVFPSLYEGFGLPPLEAMSYGVPVISSNRSCLPEVLGEAAMYFDPENYQQLADTIWQALDNQDTRLQLQENSRELLKRFSWKQLAEQTRKIYEDTGSGSV